MFHIYEKIIFVSFKMKYFIKSIVKLSYYSRILCCESAVKKQQPLMLRVYLVLFLPFYFSFPFAKEGFSYSEIRFEKEKRVVCSVLCVSMCGDAKRHSLFAYQRIDKGQSRISLHTNNCYLQFYIHTRKGNPLK